MAILPEQLVAFGKIVPAEVGIARRPAPESVVAQWVLLVEPLGSPFESDRLGFAAGVTLFDSLVLMLAVVVEIVEVEHSMVAPTVDLRTTDSKARLVVDHSIVD